MRVIVLVLALLTVACQPAPKSDPGYAIGQFGAAAADAINALR